MAEKNDARVRTLSGFMEWAIQFTDGQYLFRGVSNDTYKIEASAYRRLPKEDREDPGKLLTITQELIDSARSLGHDQNEGQPRSDLELLAHLQHYGAATCLIDFTRDVMVALWMASQQSTKEKDKKKKKAKGKVFAVRSDNLSQFRVVSDEQRRCAKIGDFFEQENKRYPLYQWQPNYQNNRIIAQESVFIFGGADIPVEAECIILPSAKQKLLTDLYRISGISEASIYPDFDGFVSQHAWNKPYREPDALNILQKGMQAVQGEKRDESTPSPDVGPLRDPLSPEATSIEAPKPRGEKK